ncbi:MAG: penicillin-binding protein 2 [Actinomycetota bacterium]
MPDAQGSAHLRLTIVGIVVLSLFAALTSRAIYLQVMDSSAFQVQARENRVRVVFEPAPRGRILDRNDQVIVDNRVANVITLSRDSAVKNPAVIDRLAALLHIDAQTIKARATDVRFSPYTPIPIVDEASEEAIVYVREHQDDFPGVEASRAAERSYPHGTLAAHLVGYVGKASQEELDARKGGNYQPGDEIGKGGVELAYEPWLRGTPGETRLEVDSGDRIVRTLFHRDPVPGHDVRLTIDLNVQTATEAALQRAMNAAHGSFDRNARKSFVAPGGAAVVMDPRDGSIRAIASYPNFDPASFVGGISTEQFKALSAPEAHAPLNDRAIGGEYAPGSTFKLATAIAALDTHLLDPRTTVVDTGKYTLKNCLGDRCVFHNAGNEAHGPVNITKAITVSSDVFFYGLGAQFWNGRATYGDAIQKEARALGLGTKTGIALIGEHAGRVPDPASRLAAHNANPKAFPNGGWRTGDNINLSIGQGEVLVTPLQLAQAYSAFAAGGKRFVPRVASDALTMTPNGPKIVATFDAKPIDSVALNGEVVQPIVAGLEGVVSDPRGTAVNAFAGFPLSQFPVAGKTGTAQVRGKQDTALFAAYAPADNPQWAVSVILEEAGFGGSVAAPVARRLFDAAFGLTRANTADVVASGID